MATDQQPQDPQAAQPAPADGQMQENQQGQQGQHGQQGQQDHADPDTIDGLANKKPEELTPEELRLMADTMPGEGPGD